MASNESDHDEVGGASYDKYGTPVTDSVVERAQAADAVLFGAVAAHSTTTYRLNIVRNRAFASA